MARGDLEHRGKPARRGGRTWTIHDPRSRRPPATAVGRAVTLDFAPGDLVRQPDDDAVLQQAGKEAPPDVSGWQTEHLAEADAAVILDELREKVLKVRPERKGHEGEL